MTPWYNEIERLDNRRSSGAASLIRLRRFRLAHQTAAIGTGRSDTGGLGVAGGTGGSRLVTGALGRARLVVLVNINVELKQHRAKHRNLLHQKGTNGLGE